MNKINVDQKLRESKLVSVVRIDADNAFDIVCSIIEGGINFIEITFTMKNALSLLKSLSERYDCRSVLIGAGTVLDAITARVAILAGAQFIVSPTFDEDTAKLCNLYQVPYIPGVHNPNDIKEALMSGCSLLKLFPASNLEPYMIKEFKGPFPQADFMISGKVNEKNIVEWLKEGASVICLGSVLTNKSTISYDEVRKIATTFVNMIKENM